MADVTRETRPRKCNCTMFKRAGICYHTGYRPAFTRQLPSPELPAIARMKNRRMSPNEIRMREQQGLNVNDSNRME